jgi:hypothetical protein
LTLFFMFQSEQVSCAASLRTIKPLHRKERDSALDLR